MPYINVKLTKKIGAAQEAHLKEELGTAICLFPGKSEDWLMCNIESEQKIWFRGDNSKDAAFIEVKLLGDVDKKSATDFTTELCNYMNIHLGISPSRTYIRFEGGEHWGWNGSNF